MRRAIAKKFCCVREGTLIGDNLLRVTYRGGTKTRLKIIGGRTSVEYEA